MDSGRVTEHGRLGPMEWAAAARPVPGQTLCGDRSIAIGAGDGGALFGVVDGLGHGEPAAKAARCAEDVLHRDVDQPLDVLIGRCHHAMTSTRGAAMTLAYIDFEADTLQWAGVGNVEAHLVARAPSGVSTRSSPRLAGGIVGYRIPEIPPPAAIPMRPGHLLVMVSDGIAETYLNDLDFAASADVLAQRILQQHSKDSDDALVLVVRHRGYSP